VKQQKSLGEDQASFITLNERREHGYLNIRGQAQLLLLLPDQKSESMANEWRQHAFLLPRRTRKLCAQGDLLALWEALVSGVR